MSLWPQAVSQSVLRLEKPAASTPVEKAPGADLLVVVVVVFVCGRRGSRHFGYFRRFQNVFDSRFFGY